MAYALRTASDPIELVEGDPIVDAADVQHPANILDLWSVADLAEIGVFPIVEPGPVPAGKVETRSTLVDDGTTITRVLTLIDVAPATLADLRSAQATAVNDRRDAILTAGYSHDFGAPNGVKLLQTRESDETNWLTLQNSCIAAVMAGQGAAAGAVIRTADNVNIALSYADGLQVTLAMSAWGAAVYAASWKLKDAIAAAADPAALAAIDITAGWPANP